MHIGCDGLGQHGRFVEIGFLGFLSAKALGDERTTKGECRSAGTDRQRTMARLAFVGIRHDRPPPHDGCRRRLQVDEHRF